MSNNREDMNDSLLGEGPQPQEPIGDDPLINNPISPRLAQPLVTPPQTNYLVLGQNTLAEFLPLIQPYDGSTSFRKFLQQFLDVANHCSWSDAEKVIAFKLKTSGEAREFLDTQRDLRVCSFNTLESRFRERFSSPPSIATNITRLTTSYQLPNENTRQFFSRLEGLSYGCVPEGCESETNENCRLQLLLSAAKQGLNRDILRGVASSGLSGYREFKAHALNFEETMILPSRAETAAIYQPGAHDMFAEMKKQIESLTRTVTSLKTQGREAPNEQQPRSRSAASCDRCNKIGHYASQCRAPFCTLCERIGHPRNACRNRSQPPPPSRRPPPSFARSQERRNPFPQNFPPPSSTHQQQQQPRNY